MTSPAYPKSTLNWDKILELLAGKAAAQRLSDRTSHFECIDQSATSSPNLTLEIAPHVQDLWSNAKSNLVSSSPETSCSLFSIPTTSSGSYVPVEKEPQRPHLSRTTSELSERARDAIYERQNRNLLNFDHLLGPFSTSQQSQSSNIGLSGDEDPPTIDRLSYPPTPAPTPEPAFTYNIPPRPRMVGIGRYRRSETAPAEWWAEKMRRHSLLLRSNSCTIERVPISTSPVESFNYINKLSPSGDIKEETVSNEGIIVMKGFKPRRLAFQDQAYCKTYEGTKLQRREPPVLRSFLGQAGFSDNLTVELGPESESTSTERLQFVRDLTASSKLSEGELPSVWSDSTCSTRSGGLLNPEKASANPRSQIPSRVQALQDSMASTVTEAPTDANFAQLDGSVLIEHAEGLSIMKFQNSGGCAVAYQLAREGAEAELGNHTSQRFHSLITKQIACGALSSTALNAVKTKRRPSKNLKGGRKVRFQRRANAMPRLGYD